MVCLKVYLGGRWRRWWLSDYCWLSLSIFSTPRRQVVGHVWLDHLGCFRRGWLRGDIVTMLLCTVYFGGYYVLFLVQQRAWCWVVEWSYLPLFLYTLADILLCRETVACWSGWVIIWSGEKRGWEVSLALMRLRSVPSSFFQLPFLS